MEISEIRKIDMQLGFTWGILIGATAAWIVITFTTNWAWYFKVFSSLGSLGIIGSLVLSLNELHKARRNYIETREEMDKINKAANLKLNARLEGEIEE